MTPTDEARFIELWQEGLTTQSIAQRLGIPEGTARSWANTLQQRGLIQPRPKGGARVRSTAAHAGTPASQPTTVHPLHPSVPLPNNLAVRLLSLLPELEALVARERDRQRLMSTPVDTPQHTVKKTYVVETLYVDLIERYACEEHLELKDVVNLAFQEFFARRHYLPEERHPS
ncbi:MAG: helix-turn-helix domain-containing protein [Candidatus Entotheonellia bacterium]